MGKWRKNKKNAFFLRFITNFAKKLFIQPAIDVFLYKFFSKRGKKTKPAP
jgi:hypothetical protein